MFERDYILRMFTILGRALARILFFRETKSYDSALLEIDNTALTLLGLNTETIERLPVDGLKDLLGPDPALLLSRLYTSGVVLKEKAEVLHLMGHEEESAELFMKSLRILTEDTKGIGDMDGGKGAATLASVILSLREYEIPADLKKRLVDFYDFSGSFDKADDIVFELVEDDPEYLRDAISFYERLMQKSDTELENGRLPRGEVQDAIDSLRTRLAGVQNG
jgi:Family of unknown function (DUF6483)